jgi:hypothetical protein
VIESELMSTLPQTDMAGCGTAGRGLGPGWNEDRLCGFTLHRSPFCVDIWGGVSWRSLRGADIIASIGEFVKNDQFRATAAEGISIAEIERLGQTAIVKGFGRRIGVDAKELTA